MNALLMDSKDPNEGLVRVRVPLTGSALQSGYESEILWAEPLGGNLYRIWNLPVLVYNLDMRAVVECEPDPDGGLPIVTRVVEEGDCFVIRLFFNPKASDDQIQTVLDLLSEHRAVLEKSSRELWAVGLRTLEDYKWIGSALAPFVRDDILTFESALQSDEPVMGETP
jgi:hypothetical protein